MHAPKRLRVIAAVAKGGEQTTCDCEARAQHACPSAFRVARGELYDAAAGVAGRGVVASRLAWPRVFQRRLVGLRSLPKLLANHRAEAKAG